MCQFEKKTITKDQEIGFKTHSIKIFDFPLIHYNRKISRLQKLKSANRGANALCIFLDLNILFSL